MSSEDVDGDWEILDPFNTAMSLVITDVCLIAKRERVPDEYSVVSGLANVVLMMTGLVAQ